MRFIYIETKFDGNIAINAKMTTKIQHNPDAVYIFLCGTAAVATRRLQLNSLTLIMRLITFNVHRQSL